MRRDDVITAIDSRQVPNFAAMRTMVKTLGDRDVTLTYRRDGTEHTANVHVYAVDRLKDTVDTTKTAAQITPDDLERVGMLGISAMAPVETVGPVDGVTESGSAMWNMTTLTFKSLGQIPGKVPNLFAALAGKERDPETPVSVIGVSRIGGELAEQRDWTSLLSFYAVLNLFFGLFNLFPLLPMDGGHIAIAWFERVRSWAYARLGRADPGRVDYYKLTPITLAVIGVLGVFVLLTGTVDIINPISLNR
jgi:membrane-associated protease RseP (regulator of RpoE activity)